MTTNYPLRKLSKLDKPDIRDTAGVSKNEIISDILLWTSSHGRAMGGRQARTYIQQLCTDTVCSLEDCRERWTIETGGERGSGRSVLAAWRDDDEDDV